MFKNLKSLFIIEEEDGSEQTAAGKGSRADQSAAKGSPANVPKATPVQKNESVEGRPGTVTPKFTEVLLRAMEAANLDGFDYLEYKQSLRSLQKMPMDESTRYQSAFAMAQTMGASPEQLMQTAAHYLDVLKKEEEKFAKAVASQQQSQIGNKEEQIKQLGEIAKSKAEQIKQLTKEIEAHQSQAAALQKEISEATVKVESTKNDFIASFNNLVSQIEQDVENMKKYLK